MKENGERPHASAKAIGDSTIVSLSCARPLEAPEDAVIALNAAWNLLMDNQEDCRYQTTRPVEGGRLLDLVRRSRRNQGPTPNLVSLQGRRRYNLLRLHTACSTPENIPSLI